MEVIILPDAQAVARQAAHLIAQQIHRNPASVLGLATGSTPEPMYAELIRIHREGKLDFSRVTTFNLDEYLGLSPDHPASYHRFMHEKLFDHINVSKDRIYIPDGLTADVPKYCAWYEERIRAVGGIDIQVLGIGSDGHIGFNEPTSSLASRMRNKTLTQKTIEDNKRFFAPSEKVPTEVLTMGVGTIMEARTCILMAHGARKASVIAKMVEGPLTAMVTASVMQLHPRTFVMIDEAAATQLQMADYYRFQWENKPEWEKRAFFCHADKR